MREKNYPKLISTSEIWCSFCNGNMKTTIILKTFSHETFIPWFYHRALNSYSYKIYWNVLTFEFYLPVFWNSVDGCFLSCFLTTVPFKILSLFNKVHGRFFKAPSSNKRVINIAYLTSQNFLKAQMFVISSCFPCFSKCCQQEMSIRTQFGSTWSWFVPHLKFNAENEYWVVSV